MSERIGVFEFKAFEEKRDQKGSRFGIMAILTAKRGKSNFCRICRGGFFLEEMSDGQLGRSILALFST